MTTFYRFNLWDVLLILTIARLVIYIGDRDWSGAADAFVICVMARIIAGYRAREGRLL